MYYRRCESCGSKALASATRCPRCEVAFELNDEHGRRHRLVPCATCKVVQPAHVDSCRWCGTVRKTGTTVPLRSFGTIAVAAVATVVLFASRDTIVPIVRSSFSTTTALASEVLRDATLATSNLRKSAPAAVTMAPSVTTGAPAPDSTRQARNSADSTQPNAVVVASATDSLVAGEEAKATTWVNVRADRSRDASIVAVLNPDDVVRLGASSAGWRQVTVAGANGWVDPRHFDIARQ